MKLNVVLLLIGLLLFALGGEGVFQAVRHRRQSTLTCGQFLSQAPRERWLRVTGCAIDYISPGIVENGGTIQELYFPVRPAGQPVTSPAPLVAATRDPQALAIAQAIIGDYKQPDQEAFVVMMLQIVTTLKASREVEGYVRGGPIERRQSRRALLARSTSTVEPPVCPRHCP